MPSYYWRGLFYEVGDPEISRSWQVGAAPRSYAFSLDSTRAKRRKLPFEKVEAQTSNVDESGSDWDEGDTRRLDLAVTKASVSTLIKLSPSCPLDKVPGALR